jgi:hypothetical protein
MVAADAADRADIIKVMNTIQGTMTMHASRVFMAIVSPRCLPHVNVMFDLLLD